MKFRLVTCAIILSCFFTVVYFYTFTSILNVSVSSNNQIMSNTIYYNQVGCFKNPDTMIGYLKSNDIEYVTYLENDFTYIISGISDDNLVTKENENLLNSKSIDSISKKIVISNSNSNIENAVLQYLNR